MQAEIYDKVRAETNGVKYEGTLMPSQTDRIVLKLKNGYNIGIITSEVAGIHKVMSSRPFRPETASLSLSVPTPGCF